MLISYQWLEKHFKEPLPGVGDLSHLLTMHAFEIEGTKQVGDDTVIDVDVLPNRSSDCLSHFGIAKEVETLTGNVARIPVVLSKTPKEEHVSTLSVDRIEQRICPLYMARAVSNVTVEESPQWMKEVLVALEQRPINNIVDATNLVMFETGQPLHAFDADKLDGDLAIRMAKKGEMITTLDGDDVSLDEETLVIADQKDPVAIAGIKGGKKALVDAGTKNIILESANFHSTSVRKTSARLKVRTESSKRFENTVPYKMAAEGMGALSALLAEIAGPEVTFKTVVKSADEKPSVGKIATTPEEINALLGANISENDIETIFSRLYLEKKDIRPKDVLLSETGALLGAPYQYGANPMKDHLAFDAAALSFYLYSCVGIHIPQHLADQYVFGRDVTPEELKAGDVIFSNTGEENGVYESAEWFPGTKISGGVDHAGVYLGDGNIIHSSRGKGEVKIESLNNNASFKDIVARKRIADLEQERWLVDVPEGRTDLRYPEDLAEEVGRVYGYENIEGTPLPQDDFTPKINMQKYYEALVQNTLRSLGFYEVISHIFSTNGEVKIQNPTNQEEPYLRTNLSESMKMILEDNKYYAPLLGRDLIRVFEIGKVFRKNKEETMIVFGVRDTISKKERRVSEAYAGLRETLKEECGITLSGEPNGGILEVSFEDLIGPLPKQESYEKLFREKTGHIAYRPLSSYPFVLRDIAVFIPEEGDPGAILKILEEESGGILVRSTLFDVFEKEFEDGKKRTSYAYHLVFQLNERTLLDSEVNAIMKRAQERLTENGFRVR